MARVRPKQSLALRAAAEEVARLSSDLEMLQTLSSTLVQKLTAVTAEKNAAREELAAAHATRGGLEARGALLEAELEAAHDVRRETQAELAAARTAARVQAHAGAGEAAGLRVQLQAQVQQLAAAQQEAQALLRSARERAGGSEAAAAALGERLREATAERDEALRGRAAAEAGRRTAEERATLAATAQQAAQQEARLESSSALARAQEAAAHAAELEAELEAQLEAERTAAEEQRSALEAELGSARTGRRGAEQREVWAHERTSVLERRRQVLRRLSGGKEEQPSQTPLGETLRERLSWPTAPSTPTTAVVSHPPLSSSSSPSWRGGGVRNERV